jgi:hypothetical protein
MTFALSPSIIPVHGHWTTTTQGIPTTVNIISVWNPLSSIITRDDRSGLPLPLSESNVQIEKKK